MILLFSVFTEAVRGISSDRADVKEKRSAFFSEPVCLLILVFSFLISCSGVKQNSAKIENGVLELSAFSIPKEEIVSLEGKWTFFWGKLYSSSEAELKQNESDFFTVPSSWNGKKLSDGTELSGQGKATYRLRIHLKDGLEKEELSFKFLSISSAYDLFINGKKIHSVGKTGGDISLETAAYLPDTVDLPHLTDKNLEILIHITNYHHNKGGIWRKILFGRKKDIQRKRYLELFQDVFLAGSLFIIGIYHLGIYYQIRKEKFSLYFALFCLMVFLRICFTGEMIFSYLFPNFPWNWQITFEYVNFQLAVVFGL
ncbi:MAG TPA: 7TM diverse intracellular signaling domain-containing protein, partial [Leptospiraceae bacterium]|nr:7TM diverse intracellular signaling domain-containing protein [Leptospiraceae bacterium]